MDIKLVTTQMTGSCQGSLIVSEDSAAAEAAGGAGAGAAGEAVLVAADSRAAIERSRMRRLPAFLANARANTSGYILYNFSLEHEFCRDDRAGHR